MAKLITKAIADLSVTTIKIADGAINNAKVHATAGIVESKLALDYSTSGLNSAISTVSGNLASHVGNTSNPHSVTKTQVGLGNVDNTSDVNKPVSTAQQAALDLKANLSLVGAVSGIASLDGTGKVPSSQLPSYVDDVIEVANFAALPVTGETGKIYVTLDTNETFRWSGTVYVEIATGDVASVNSMTGNVILDADDISDAATTNKFATAAEKTKLGFITVTQAVDLDTIESDLSGHIANTSNPHSVTKTQVGLGNVTDDAQLKAADLDIDGALAANSDSKIPSQKAVKTYADTKEPANANIQSHISSTSNPHSVTKTQVGLGNVDNVQQLPMSYLDTDGTLAANSDTKVASQKAVKTFVAASISAIPAAAQAREENISLSAGNISDGFFDLALAAANAASIQVIPVGWIPQEKGVDFSVALTGGAGGVTRITMLADMLELVATDKVVIRYMA